MKKNSLKLAQKGGMMIEALAMLGLIAVVTPTMYKKSAERTLEVEDINTATTMRSVMTAADSYVSSHYGELFQEISANETNNKSKTLDLEDDLKPYLPYGFNADKLYDFGEPQVSVVRNGNNLTAFVLFPAKEDGENGLGQERTVRIATLVGANGGYVNGDQTAKGIGGIWNLNKTDFQTVFGSTDSSKPEVYSIVTASSDAINNTNTEEDTDKFLYRTDANGKWHNTMRADLYMGGNTDEHDGYDASDPKSQPFSIRNIKSLIVGTQNADDETKYGLYIRGSGENFAENSAAYIRGELLAAMDANGRPNFYADKDSIQARPDENGNYDFKLDTSMGFGYNNDKGAEGSGWNYGRNFTVNKDGSIYSRGKAIIAGDTNGAWQNVKIGAFSSNDDENKSILYGEYNGGTGIAALMGNRGIVVQDTSATGGESDGRILIANTGYRNDETNTSAPEIKYNTANAVNNSIKGPIFPVKIAANTKVDAILATRQLDTQNIRTAELEVGSANIDDANKWLKVDADGIHGRSPTGVIYTDINDSGIRYTYGNEAYNGFTEGSVDNNGSGSNIEMSVDGLKAESNKEINIRTSNENAPINIKNNTIQQQIAGTDVVFSSLQDSGYSTNVKIQKTNFEVSDENDKRVFAVRGNTKSEDDKLKSTGDFDVAVHGDTVFTPQGVEKAYLTVGNEYADNPDDTGVAISKSSDNDISNAMYIDVGSNSVSRNRPGNEVKDKNRWNMNDKYYAPGTVYVRKGMVEVLPGKPNINAEKGLDSATSGNGFISAGRFVANNLDEDGNDVKVPEFFTGNDYTDYNGATSKRYDTYMVNPAYTSVMHDIKLTTRGGARLSDILPDFINKGIYITSNTYQDNIKKMSFKFDSSSKKVVPAGTGDTATPLSGSIVLGNSDSWASPYLGFVPAPQCPPGYNRVITMAPQSFMMAQAGQMQKGTNPREAAYYVKNQVPDSTAFDHYTDTVTQNGAYVQQAFVAPSVSENSEVTTGGTANTQGKKITGANGSTTAEYFLASFGDKTVPLTIQQSTWLKTNVIPVDNTGSSYSVGDTNSGHTIGWAALMGFVYDAATYQTIIDKLSGNIQYNDGNNNVYWNVFPVRRNTLEAYATTYCYFDRTGIMWNEFKDGGYGEYIDHYNALKDYGNYTEKKNLDSKYKERLNDPTLKYDEVW